MKKVVFFLINIFLGVISLFSEEKLNLELLEKYYTAENIPKTEILDFYSKYKNIYMNNNSQENLIEYIKACTLLSTLYSSGEIPEYQTEIESVDLNLQNEIKKYPFSSIELMAYADYVYSEFSWKKDTTYNIFVLPNIYRRIINLDKSNDEALVKLALWYITASYYFTSNWNSFIAKQEAKIENLSNPDKFNGFLLYSMFYMKKYDVKKGMMYLNKARELYPENPLTFIIEQNYKNGKIGW